MPPRAAPMPPAARRDALIAATLPLVRAHGREVTTRQIARAAGVAEGTIFRVFATKEELVDATLDKAFEPGRMQNDVATIDATLPLRERLLAVVTVFQQRFTESFDLMIKVGMVGPPNKHKHPQKHPHRHHGEDELRARWRELLAQQLVELIGEDAEQLRVPPGFLMHVVRLLAFAGSHPSISDGRLLTPEEIVDVLLYGVLRDPESVQEKVSV